MPDTFPCPACSRQLRVPGNLVGRLVKCPSCETTFVAAADIPDVLPTPPSDREPGEPPPPGRSPVGEGRYQEEVPWGEARGGRGPARDEDEGGYRGEPGRPAEFPTVLPG